MISYILSNIHSIDKTVRKNVTEQNDQLDSYKNSQISVWHVNTT